VSPGTTDPPNSTVFSVKSVQKEMVITATSGTAAAGIGGNTIHSARGLTFKDRDGQVQDNMPGSATKERSNGGGAGNY
jgi:hypothetical protein